MSVNDGGVTYGCTDALEDRAYGISYAGRDLARLLMKGGSLPSKYTIAGQNYRVTGISGVSADGSTNNQSALENAVSASRNGEPTLLVLPPAEDYYRYSNHLELSENTYLVGYGAKVKPLAVDETKFDVNNDSGIIGLTMHSLYGAMSRWPERFEANNTVEGAKDGSIAIAADDSNDAAWVTMFLKTNCIMFDVATTGSLSGALRCDSSNVIVENCSAVRTHSDSFHFFKGASNCTARRNRIYNAGDDAISVVQYVDSPGGAIPSNILIEENLVKGGRARGLTVVSGQDILYRRNVVEDITLAGYRFGPTKAHSLNDTARIKVQDCQAWRCGRMQANHPNSGSFAALLSTTQYRCLDVAFANCVGYSYGDDQYANSDLVRVANSFGDGGLTYETDGVSGIVKIDHTQ